MKDCVDNDINEGDFVIYVVQGNRNAGINFGWIYTIDDRSKTHTRSDGQSYTSHDIRLKIQRADADGTRHTVKAVDVPAHWRDHTPQAVLDYHNNSVNSVMGWQEYWRARQDYWVEATMRDTGKPDTTILKCVESEHRLFVTQPV